MVDNKASGSPTRYADLKSKYEPMDLRPTLQPVLDDGWLPQPQPEARYCEDGGSGLGHLVLSPVTVLVCPGYRPNVVVASAELKD